MPNRTRLRFASANVMMVANAFIWYLLAFDTLKDLLAKQGSDSWTLLLIGVNTGAIVVSAFFGSFLFDKILKKRGDFLLFWLASGVILSIIPLGLNVSTFNGLMVISLVFGLYFGVGMPATMGYHSSVTSVEDRAKVSGISFLIIGIIFAIIGLVVFDSLVASCLILAGIRLIGLILFSLLKGKEVTPQQLNSVKYTQIITSKSFLLYFVPWCMFTLVNFLTMPIQNKIFAADSFNLLIMLENIVGAVVAVISGFLADRWGRKRLSIIGFMMLGIGYAVIGIFSIIGADLMLGGAIYFIADGIAWGIFFVLFIFTLWGDLAQNRNGDKYYFLGALPYVSSYFLQLLFAPYLSTPTLSITAAAATIFPFASIFLFLAVLPLIYAPETLPEKTMKDRDLKSYVEKVKKIAQKEQEKNQRDDKKNEQGTQQLEESSKEKNADDYEKAKALAEKYY